MAEVEVPSGFTGPVPVMVEFEATGVPPMKTTFSPVFATGVRICKVLVSALVDFKVQVETPVAFVRLQAVCVLAAPVLVAEKVGVEPLIGLLNWSLIVTEMVERAILSATTGLVPAMVENAIAAGPGLKMTVPSFLLTGLVMLRVFVSAFLDVKVQV